MPEVLNTRDLLARLQRHYIKPSEALPGGVFLPECGWNGQGGISQCDALYVGFTSSSGRILIGHELKISRADWLRELAKPGKADDWADQCHEWWLVVSDPAIVHPGELPAGWGLMSPGRSKTRLLAHVTAERRPRDHRPSWDAVRAIMARQDTLRANAIAAAKQKANQDAQAEVRKQVEAEVSRRQGITPEVERARSLVATIQARRRANRLPHELEIEELADAVCEVLDGHRLLESLQGIAQHRLNQIENAMRDLKTDWQYKNLTEQLREAMAPVSREVGA